MIAIRHLPDGQEIGKTGIRAVKFVDGQLIVTGRRTEVRTQLSRANDRYSGINIDLDRPIPLSEIDTKYGVGIDLYSFTTGREVDAIGLADFVRADAAGMKRVVLADPNYVVAAPDHGVPAQALGSGCGTEVWANPGSGEASPIGGSAAPFLPEGGATPAQGFCGQWAFGPAIMGGINLTGRPRDLPGAENSQIIILDTSPWERPGRAIFSGDGWATPALDICVELPTDVRLTMTEACKKALFYQGDHGLFVAGLAHAVAPASSIHLLRVLNEHGIGLIAGIIHTLEGLDRQQLADRHTVINLSLGMTPIALYQPIGLKRYCNRLVEEKMIERCDLASIYSKVDELTRQLTPEQFKQMTDEWQSIEWVLHDLGQSGVVIAAAAGNQSGRIAASPAEAPASFAYDTMCYPNMLAVAATTHDRERAFYSNAGTIAAPGGGGNRQNPWDLSTDWLVSVAYLDDLQGGRCFSYGRWEGTSFATPLVSGMAAEALSGAAGQTPPERAANAVLQVMTQVSQPISNPLGQLGEGIITF